METLSSPSQFLLHVAMPRAPWCHSDRSVLVLPVGSSSGPSARQNASAPTSRFISCAAAHHLVGILIGSVGYFFVLAAQCVGLRGVKPRLC